MIRIREALLHTDYWGVVERIYERSRNVYTYLHIFVGQTFWPLWLQESCVNNIKCNVTPSVPIKGEHPRALGERKISSFFAVLSQENHFSLQFPIPRKKTVFFFAHQKPSTRLLVNTMD